MCIRDRNYTDSATFFSDFEKTVNELKNAGASVSEKEKLNYMLNTLPESYSYIGDLIDALKEEDQTVDYVKSKIQMTEIKHQKDEYSGRKSNAFMEDKSRQQRTCFQCGKTGHIKRDCKYGGQAAGSSNTWRAPRGRQETEKSNYARGHGNFRSQRGSRAHQATQSQQENPDTSAWVISCLLYTSRCV